MKPARWAAMGSCAWPRTPDDGRFAGVDGCCRRSSNTRWTLTWRCRRGRLLASSFTLYSRERRRDVLERR
eukprot:1313895-Rhodomonas_salina.4